MTDSPELSGLLYKRRGGFGKIMPNAWQYRFFTISKDGILQYFDTEIPDTDSLDSRARGRLDLRSVNYEVSVEAIEGAPTQYPIQIIVPNEETWKMCAYGKEDQQRWIKAIEKYQNEKVTKTANVVASYTSDDDGERVKRAAPKTPRESVLQTASSLADISTKVDKIEGVAAPTRASVVATATPQPAISEPAGAIPLPAAKTQRRGSINKRRLKLAGNKGFVDQDLGELLLVIAIVNICIVGLVQSRGLIIKVFYWVIANFVVAHTLNLRSQRGKKSGKDQIAQSILDVETISSHTALKVTPKVEDAKAIEKEPVPVRVEESEVEKPLVTAGQKPIPGQTYIKAEGDPRKAPAHTWSVVDHRQFNVRVGPNYDRYKRKAPSGPAIYEPFAVDVFCTKSRVDHAALRFQLPDCTGINTNNKFVPPLFIIQIQIPSEPPPSFFSTVEDGPGWAVVMYFRITEEACAQLKDINSASPALRLFAQWCEKAETDPAWRGRFKVINSCTNLSEIGVPSAIEAYNAKPVLIRRTGSIFRGENHMEMNIHVHKFANLAKQSIYLLSSRCAQLYMQIGFVIEGRDDSELPETLFACVAINRPQEDQAEFIFDDY